MDALSMTSTYICSFLTYFRTHIWCLFGRFHRELMSNVVDTTVSIVACKWRHVVCQNYLNHDLQSITQMLWAEPLPVESGWTTRVGWQSLSVFHSWSCRWCSPCPWQHTISPRAIPCFCHRFPEAFCWHWLGCYPNTSGNLQDDNEMVIMKDSMKFNISIFPG